MACQNRSIGRVRQDAASVFPHGSWVSYAYDSQGRTVLEQRPWLSSPSSPQGASTSAGHVLQYEYAADASATTPLVVRERIEGDLVGVTYNEVTDTPQGRVVIESRCLTDSGPHGEGCLRTETASYAVDSELLQAGKTRYVITPDDRRTSYTYERGNVDANGGFDPDSTGRAERQITVHGTRSSPNGVAHRTMREITVRDERGQVVLEEQELYTGGDSYVPLSWTLHTYNEDGRRESTLRSNGELEEASWGCCNEDSTTDSRGIVTSVQARDALERVRVSQRAAIATTYTYDAEGRVLATTREGGGLTLTSEQEYDGAGRLVRSVDEQGLETTYAYELGGLRTVVTRPGGFTEVTERHLDGQAKSATGTAVVEQQTTHGVDAVGRWTQVCSGPSGSGACEKSWVDRLGRTIRVERPGYSGSVEVAETFYNAKGQVARTTAPGMADTLYEYDELGAQVRSGLDVNGNGVLDESGNDRLRETDSYFVEVLGDWWPESIELVYASSSAETTLVSTQRSRVTGFEGGVVGEQVSVDVHGNETRSTVHVNRSEFTETRTTDTPDSNIDAVSVTRNGRLVSSTSPTGITTTFGYDGLGRRTRVIDSRTGESTTVYDGDGRVEAVVDAAGNSTTFGYEASTGRKRSECNALGNCSYFSYNARGQLERTWGEVPYPVQYVYDDSGRRVEMHTYRDESFDWSSAQWPDGSSIAADVTTWSYEDATGLLLSKLDASGEATSYTYGPAGRLATRTWARERTGGGALTTTYECDPETGELLEVDYNDSTPDVVYSYDRLGRQETVEDGVGTRTFAYDPDTLQLESETVTGVAPAVLTRQYATSGPVIGRSSGMTLGAGYAVEYGFASNGRLEAVSWNVNGEDDSATYGFVPGSELLAGYATTSGLDVSYAYEPQRDLKTQVSNSFGGSVVSQYDYRYDAIGRRTSVENSGSAFGPTEFTQWGYDDRNQVTASNRYNGAFTASPNPANEVAPERRDYDYDPIGNRETALDQDGTTSITYAANELNQYEQVGQQAPVYDEDGNLLNDGTKVLQYNAENQLVRVEVPGTSVSTFEYDYIGRRIRKSVDLVSGDDYVVTWVYSGWNKIEERKTVGATTTVKNFVWGLDLSQSMEGAGGIGGLLAVVDGSGAASLFAYDGNGNVSELIDASSGNVAAHYEFDAFGNSVVATGPLAQENTYRFSTKQSDPETGLYDYGYRPYLPEMGRWVQRDPIGDRGGLNLYGMVRNRTTDSIDPLGLLTWTNGQSKYTRGPYPLVVTGWPPGTNGTEALLATDFAASIPRATMEFSCEKCGPVWKLKKPGITIKFSIEVYLQTPFPSPAAEAWTVRAEDDHVADYMAWANRKGKIVAEETEKQLLDDWWITADRCAMKVHAIMLEALLPSLEQTINASLRQWDASGLHNWASPMRRP